MNSSHKFYALIHNSKQKPLNLVWNNIIISQAPTNISYIYWLIENNESEEVKEYKQST